MKEKKVCGYCAYFIFTILPVKGICKRFPKHETKNADDTCGEFRDKRILNEG